MQNSPQAPCWQQIQIAKQNSWLDSRRQGKALVYEAPCRVDPKPIEPARPRQEQPRTS